MRPGGRVDDRVGAIALELVVVPARPLAAVVLGVADPDRLLVQRLGGRGRVEDELDHLPVALVQVVELVEVVEEPVLEGELSRRVRLGHDVRVGDGGVTLAERDGVAGVGAPGIEGAPGVVEAPLGALAEEVGGGRRRRPRVVRRSAQHDVPAPQDDLDRRGDVLLAAGVARRVLLLLDLQEGAKRSASRCSSVGAAAAEAASASSRPKASSRRAAFLRWCPSRPRGAAPPTRAPPR